MEGDEEAAKGDMIWGYQEEGKRGREYRTK